MNNEPDGKFNLEKADLTIVKGRERMSDTIEKRPIKLYSYMRRDMPNKFLTT